MHVVDGRVGATAGGHFRAVHPFADYAVSACGSVSTRRTRVPDSDGPKVSITRATIWREHHSPQAWSGGRTALIWRKVRLLIAAAPRARSEPRDGRAGSSVSTALVQQPMMTFVNVSNFQWR